MTSERVSEDLIRMYEEWLKDSRSSYLADKADWARGVAHGIKLAIHRVHQHRDAAVVVHG